MSSAEPASTADAQRLWDCFHHRGCHEPAINPTSNDNPASNRSRGTTRLAFGTSDAACWMRLAHGIHRSKRRLTTASDDHFHRGGNPAPASLARRCHLLNSRNSRTQRHCGVRLLLSRSDASCRGIFPAGAGLIRRWQHSPLRQYGRLVSQPDARERRLMLRAYRYPKGEGLAPQHNTHLYG